MPEEDKKLPASLGGALGDLLTRTFGSAADDFGAYLSDKMRAKRIRNLEAIAEKAHRMLSDSPPKNAPLPLKTALPIFEYASLEEDDYLREKWAALLASTLVGNVLPYFPNLLGQLAPADVQILDILYEISVDCPSELDHGMPIDSLKPTTNTADEEFHDLAIANLIRQGLCEYCDILYSNPPNIGLTKFGFAFVRACKSPNEKKQETEDKP